MAAALTHDDVEQFEHIFASPNIPDLLAMSPNTFEKFVGYVLPALSLLGPHNLRPIA
jgi:hypothetical protein